MWRAAERKESYEISGKLRKVAENGKICSTATTAQLNCALDWKGQSSKFSLNFVKFHVFHSTQASLT